MVKYNVDISHAFFQITDDRLLKTIISDFFEVSRELLKKMSQEQLIATFLTYSLNDFMKKKYPNAIFRNKAS